MATTNLTAADVRVSDTDRDRVGDLLRVHVRDGRLTLDEFAERVDGAYEARTRAELDVVTADLPPVAPPSSIRQQADPRKEFAGHLRAYLLVNALLVAVWLLTGAGYPWVIWPLLGWGIGVVSHAREVRNGPATAALGRTSRRGCAR